MNENNREINKMKIKQHLLKYTTPFLLISYICLTRADIMILQGKVGFGLPFIGLLIAFGLLFIFFDFFLKKMLFAKCSENDKKRIS
jgi:hypothetical protein